MNYILEILGFMLSAIQDVWWLLLVSIPFAALMKVSGNNDKIRRYLSGKQVPAIFLAVIIGAVSPLCSCSVIPAVAALLGSGVPLGPIMAFWIASPSMDPEIFLLSATTLGWELAVWRILATALISLFGGFAALALTKSGIIRGPLLREPRSKATTKPASKPITPSFLPGIVPVPAAVATGSRCSSAVSLTPLQTAECSCESACQTDIRELATEEQLQSYKRSHAFDGALKRIVSSDFMREVRHSGIMVLKFMLLAYFIEALVVLYLPESVIPALFGSNATANVFIATLMGIPLYTTNLSAMGLVGGMISQGLAPGAGLSFLIAGATTTLPAMAAVYGITQKKVFALYLGIAVTGALASGLLFSILS